MNRPRDMVLLLSAVLLGALASPLRAATHATPILVKDINPGFASSSPQKLLPIGNRLFFGASNGLTGIEPMASDGTLAGTVALGDLWLGANSGFPLGCVDCNAIAIGGTAYFTAFEGSGGSRLWKSNGTPAGTSRVYADAAVSDLVDANGTIFFAGVPNGGSVAFLYRSDGTTGGTTRVTDSALLTGYGMAAMNGAVYFPASEGVAGTELWRSDGTEVGTVRLSDLNTGSSSSSPTFLTRVGNRMYFYGFTNTAPSICVSDGTPGGTSALFPVSMVSDRTTPRQIADLNGVAMFIASDPATGYELWRSDGTPAGTFRVKDVYPGSVSGLDGSALVTMGNAVYFAASDGVHGRELWKSDGTAAGTVMVKDLDPQFGAFGSGSPTALTNISGTLYFTATSGGSSGFQPWTSDGTELGTSQLGVVHPTGSSQAASFTEVNGTVFFTATDGASGIELWSVAGPTVGVEPVPHGMLPGVTLAASAPNPVRSRSRITFTLAHAQAVKLTLYDLSGRIMQTLQEGTLGAGSHQVEWDAMGVANGLYVCRLATANGSVERKVLVTR